MKPDSQDESPSQFELFRAALQRRVRHWLDSSVPHVVARWAAFAGLLALFFLRVYLLQGFFIVAYALMIFVLNQFIGFISPPVSRYCPAPESARRLPESAFRFYIPQPPIRVRPDYSTYHTIMYFHNIADRS